MEHILIQCLQSKIETNGSLYGRFQLGPFDKDHSLTIANAMRRTLLSELSGLGILCVEIQGINHEYSHLKGVRESVLDILLNLKEIVFLSKKKFSQPEIGFLKIHGPATIKGCHLKLPSGIQCVNPNQYIATLGNTGVLKMKFMVCKGKNCLTQTSLVVIEKYFQSHFYVKNNLDWENISNWKTNSTEQIVKTHFLKKISKQNLKNNTKNIDKQTLNLNSWSPKIFQQSNLSIFLQSINKIAVGSNRLKLKNKQTKKFFLHKKNNFSKFEKNLLFYKQKISKLQQITNLQIKQNLKKNASTNVLFLDTVFMPIKKVNFLIQTINQYPKIQKSNLLSKFQINSFQEKIILEIWTNGSVHPQTALYQAAQKIIEMFVPLQTKYGIKTQYNKINTNKNKTIQIN